MWRRRQGIGQKEFQCTQLNKRQTGRPSLLSSLDEGPQKCTISNKNPVKTVICMKYKNISLQISQNQTTRETYFMCPPPPRETQKRQHKSSQGRGSTHVIVTCHAASLPGLTLMAILGPQSSSGQAKAQGHQWVPFFKNSSPTKSLTLK